MQWTTFCTLHRFSASIIKHNLVESIFVFFALLHNILHRRSTNFPIFPFHFQFQQLNIVNNSQKKRAFLCKKNVIVFCDFLNERFMTMWSIEKLVRKSRAIHAKHDAATNILLLFLVTWFSSLAFPFWHLLLVLTSIAHEKLSIFTNRKLNWINGYLCRLQSLSWYRFWKDVAVLARHKLRYHQLCSLIFQLQSELSVDPCS